MKILAIETSTKYLGLAVVSPEGILAEYSVLLERQISKFLIVKIRDILGDVGLSIGDIDGFAVSIGPGSFTGLRVGVTTAKGLAIAANKPLVGVPTLDVLAMNAAYFPGKICALVDAKKSSVYSAIYEFSGGKLLRKSRYAVEPIRDTLAKAKDEAIFLGDGVALYRKDIMKYKKKGAAFATENLWYPRAGHVGLLALEKFKKGKQDDPYDLAPMYLHPRTCTIIAQSEKRKAKSLSVKLKTF